ncbi:type IV pilus modification protein PilV [Thiorhodococcus mannitoliphagus]|uniref:Type IV pilus modification protein PilV n=1 Tax=Thiorhodococcus mannitoliphagus TaxID=329406 RepID=A0A6P1DYI3_9GAMM|nr:type IV pilus modification protein PilV [Thiorhodococcus mannitoliphagus]NEX23278.1 type IV pilus modification protein PilV [Thiorhodococcus mannitoliphagus]
MSIRADRQGPSLQLGFTLIEALVAAVVLSVGLLGLGGLLGISVRMNQGALLRTQATNLAYEITDAMRANRANAAAYAGNYTTACSVSYARTGSVIATADVNEWNNRLACLLPQGNGAVAVTTSGSRITVTVTVTWNEQVRFGGNAAESFIFTTEL